MCNLKKDSDIHKTENAKTERSNQIRNSLISQDLHGAQLTINRCRACKASNSTRYAFKQKCERVISPGEQISGWREHDLPTFRPQMQEQGAHGALIIETRIIFLERRRAPDKPRDGIISNCTDLIPSYNARRLSE